MLDLVPYDYDSAALLELQLKWENDPSIRHLFNYFPSEEASQVFTTRGALQERWTKERALPNVKRYSIEVEGQSIGELSFSLAHPCCNRDPQAAWLGIVIGESSAWGRGYGREAIRLIEAEALRMGASRIELGVFEFNTRARKLYTSLGYVQTRVIPDFTWWNGRLWSDIRMCKTLS